jgi:hypothetical protein
VKLKIIYDADGTSELVIKGYRISSQELSHKGLLVKVYNKKGKKVRALQISKYYIAEKDRR